MNKLTDEERDAMTEYVLKNGDDPAFTASFWRRCEPSETDLRQYRKFVSAIRLAFVGATDGEISAKVGASRPTIRTWVEVTQMPKLAHFLNAYLRLGEPSAGKCWLSIECSHGYELPLGPFVEVPSEIGRWSDVAGLLAKLKPIDLKSELDQAHLFGFFLGMMIGDANKSGQRSSHRHIGLVLSKRYDANEKLGDFTCLCAKSMGLRMHRVADQPKKGHKPHGFYEWVSQSSPLIDWIFNVCLGLKDGEVTTYNPLRADWMLEGPETFRLGLVQGLAESDGSVNIAGQEVEFWIGPNWDFMKGLLATFGLRAFRSREATTLSKKEAIRSFRVPIFSPQIKTVRYQRLQRLAMGKKLARGGSRLSDEMSSEIGALRQEGISIPGIIERLLDEHGLLVSYETAQRWASSERRP